MSHSLLNFSPPHNDQNCRERGPFLPGDPRESRVDLPFGDSHSDLRNIFILLIN